MRFKQLLYILIYLCCTSSVVAQSFHELKIEVIGLLNEDIITSYEVGLSEHIGVEVTMGFDLSNAIITESQIITEGDIQRLNFLKFEFSQARFNPSVGAKYYFSNKKIGSGFFLGPHVGADVLLNRDQGYAIKWEEVFSSIGNERRKSEGLKSINPGLIFGYKWLLKSHFILELKGLLLAEQPVGVGASEASRGFDGDAVFNIGYRF